MIIACGYESNGVPILDCMGSNVPLQTKASLSSHAPVCVDVNSNCMIMNSLTGRPIQGLFGIG